MPLTNAQLTTIKTYCQGSADPTIQSAMAAGNIPVLLGVLNGASSSGTQAWQWQATAVTIDGGATYTTYDSLSQGKRDSWSIFLKYAPRDMSKQSNRGTVTDVWGNANTSSAVSFAVLTACLTTATLAQHVIGGPPRSTGLVSGLALNYTDNVSENEARQIVAP